MKNYDVNMQVSIGNTESYNTVYPLKFNITESLPANVDAQKYIRQRLSEELARHFKQLRAPLDNFDAEVAENADPLAPEPVNSF